ncbi:MAG: ion transporter [Oscillibacter sp.]|nr:ion transporter [Oscillibacter sp.]
MRKRKQRVFELVEVGYAGDFYSRAYDFLGVVAILVNLAVSVLDTYDEIHNHYGGLLSALETVTVLFFTLDYALRVWTASELYPTERHPVRKYVLSMTGLIDLLCFLPWYLPVFFPAGAVAFRMFRVVRIFRLFRINTYYDSLNVITEVISGKRQQLFSSVFILCVLMLGASLCMYSLEHEAQPDVFANAFSGIWWAASTLLTVGYGDIYPMTAAGRLFGICITFLGVGIVAIPTGIISAGFVEQYSKIKRLSEIADEVDIHFIKFRLSRQDTWTGKSVKELGLPKGVILAAIRRGQEVIVPRGGVVLADGDTVILGAEPLRDDQHIDFQEVTLRRQHPWNGKAVRDLDISRHTLIVAVRRGSRALIPNGDLVLKEGDTLTLYTQIPMSDAEKVRI